MRSREIADVVSNGKSLIIGIVQVVLSGTAVHLTNVSAARCNASSLLPTAEAVSVVFRRRTGRKQTSSATAASLHKIPVNGLSRGYPTTTATF